MTFHCNCSKCMGVDSLSLARIYIRKPLLGLHIFKFCVSIVKEFCLSTLKCHDQDILISANQIAVR